MTKTQIKTARKLANLADEGGVIQGRDLVRVFRGRPELHTTMTLRAAWSHALPGIDADTVSEALWG